MRKLYLAIGTALVAMLVAAGTVFAAVTLNSDGTGFVGKGDVQLAYSSNNKQLQDNLGNFAFRAKSVSETTWTCVHNDNPNAEDQYKSITTTTQGLVSSVERVKNQITGFRLLGFDGPTTTSTEGPVLHSCGANRTYVPGSDVTTSQGSMVEVSLSGGAWIPL